MGWIPAIVGALDEVVFHHVAQARYQCATADGEQPRMQLHRASGAGGEIARDQQRPFVANHL